jgi:hypothetical protein
MACKIAMAQPEKCNMSKETAHQQFQYQPQQHPHVHNLLTMDFGTNFAIRIPVKERIGKFYIRKCVSSQQKIQLVIKDVPACSLRMPNRMSELNACNLFRTCLEMQNK